MSLRNTPALVTGAGRGLGAALARKLAARGARVVLVARHLEAVEAVAASIRAAGGVAHALAADVGKKDDIYPLVGAAAALVGPLELLVHNAGSLGPVPLKLMLDTTCEEVEEALAVNLLGPFRLSRAVAGAMLVHGRGTIVSISSDAAVEAYPMWGAYGLSKAALEHATRTFAAELAGTGVRFWIADPGEMATKMHADALPDADPATLNDPDVIAARLVDRLEDGLVSGGARIALGSAA